MAVVPTYGERANVEPLIRRIRALPLDVEILFVDDEAADDTAGAVVGFLEVDPKVHLLRREGPRGRGLAGRDGFLFALEMGADAIVEMDADLSHPPECIPHLLAGLTHHDVVLGSRAIAGGSDPDRGWRRRMITNVSNSFARHLLGVSVRDCNSGFRAYRRNALTRLDPATLSSRGPDIVHEVLLRAHRMGLSIGEVPITFVDRERGDSTLGLKTLTRGFWRILELRRNFPKRSI